MKNIRLILSVIILAVSITLLVWGFSPNLRVTKTQTIAPYEVQFDSPTLEPATEPPVVLPTSVVNPSATATPRGDGWETDSGDGEDSPPDLPEFRHLILEYPRVIKADSGSEVIILTLEVNPQSYVTIIQVNDNGNVVEENIVEVPNLYTTHNITAEAYYQVAGLEVVPPGSTFQPLKQGKRVKFTWSVRAQDVGTYGGTIFLFLNFENRETGEKDRKEISIQIFDIKVVDLFGFSTNFVKTTGVVGYMLGTIVGFPFFKDIAKYLYGKLKKNKPKPRKPKPKT